MIFEKIFHKLFNSRKYKSDKFLRKNKEKLKFFKDYLEPEIKNIYGRKVILRIEKKFNRLEKLLAKIFRAPKEIRRPLDDKNSMLWQLCDGTRKFEDICKILDSLFHEDISPVIHRTAAGINLLKEKNLVTILNDEFTRKWSIGQGITPKNQTLNELDTSLGIIVEEE